MLGRLFQQVKSSQERSIFYFRKHLICPLPYNKKKHGIQTFKMFPYTQSYTLIVIRKKANFYIEKIMNC